MKRSKQPKTTSIKRSKKTGPKRMFTPEMIEDVENLVGTYGARTKELALYFDVCESSIEYWIKNYPVFERAVKRGRVAIGLKVAKALVAKALGYSHPDTHVLSRQVKTYNEQGRIISSDTEPLLVPLIKHYPPDAYAAHKYLTIMFREVWAENSELNINHKVSGSVEYKKVEEIPMEDLTEEQRNLIFEINMKQLNNIGNN